MSARRILAWSVLAGLLAGLTLPTRTNAQETAGISSVDALSSAVAAARDGVVRFEFEARPNVWGDGRSWNSGSMRGEGDHCRRCTNGPVRVTVRVSSGRPAEVRSQVGGDWKVEGRDLGKVAPQAAADYLLGLAETMPEKHAGQAMQAAVAADAAEIWPRLLEIARDRSRPDDVRSTALFWVANEAGDMAATDLEGIAVASNEPLGVQEAALFAITQLPEDRGTDILLDIARENRNPDIVPTLYFWLGQSGDPRALELFEEVLMK